MPNITFSMLGNQGLTMFCHNCGRANDDGARFCNDCGTGLVGRIFQAKVMALLIVALVASVQGDYTILRTNVEATGTDSNGRVSNQQGPVTFKMKKFNDGWRIVDIN